MIGHETRDCGTTDFSPRTAELVVIDPLYDFLSSRGKGWPLLRPVARRVGLLGNLRRALDAARLSGLAIAYAPHHRHRRGDPLPRFPSPSQILGHRSRFFEAGRPGGEFYPDLAPAPGEFVAREHEVSSAFGGTDLHSHLRGKGISHIVLCGLLSNTCVESTARQGVDLGYGVTVLVDAVASWSHRDHDSAVEGSLRLVAHRLTSTGEFARTIAGDGSHDHSHNRDAPPR